MKHDEFIGQVQHRARLGSRGAAERATLETLAERLAGGEAKELAAQLPPELAEHLWSGWSAMGERFTLQEFFRRVSQREGVDVPDAVFHARAVIEVLSEAVSRGKWTMSVPSSLLSLIGCSRRAVPGRCQRLSEKSRA